MLTTHNLTEAGRWADPNTGAQGPTVPYTDAAITAQVVFEGSAIDTSREDIEAELTITDAAPYVGTASPRHPRSTGTARTAPRRPGHIA